MSPFPPGNGPFLTKIRGQWPKNSAFLCVFDSFAFFLIEWTRKTPRFYPLFDEEDGNGK